jgi:proteasome lid subunit RPN8/RPN11
MLDEMIAHAREDAPNECCGVIAVAEGRATRLYRMTNLKASPLAFEVAPRELLRIDGEIEDAGWELGAIYHSHTRTAPYPSQTDINFAANWPGVEWIIIGLAGCEPEVRSDCEPEVRSYTIDAGQVAEAAIEVFEAAIEVLREEPVR